MFCFVFLRDQDEQTPLHFAALTGSLDTVKLLLRASFTCLNALDKKQVRTVRYLQLVSISMQCIKHEVECFITQGITECLTQAFLVL